ncbi:hypothetical protein T4B_3516, partial [Trichinella pseudospiralis]
LVSEKFLIFHLKHTQTNFQNFFSIVITEIVPFTVGQSIAHFRYFTSDQLEFIFNTIFIEQRVQLILVSLENCFSFLFKMSRFHYSQMRISVGNRHLSRHAQFGDAIQHLHLAIQFAQQPFARVQRIAIFWNIIRIFGRNFIIFQIRWCYASFGKIHRHRVLFCNGIGYPVKNSIFIRSDQMSYRNSTNRIRAYVVQEEIDHLVRSYVAVNLWWNYFVIRHCLIISVEHQLLIPNHCIFVTIQIRPSHLIGHRTVADFRKHNHIVQIVVDFQIDSSQNANITGNNGRTLRHQHFASNDTLIFTR